MTENNRIAILVPNPCNPDYRVIKYAEIMTKLGYNVRVYCGRNSETPDTEEINNVLYVRRFIVPNRFTKFISPRYSIKTTGQISSTDETIKNKKIDASKPIYQSEKRRNSIKSIAVETGLFFLRSAKKAAAAINRYSAYKYQPILFQRAFQREIISWRPAVIHCNDWQTLMLGVNIKKKINSVLIFDSHELETHRNPPLPESRRRWMGQYESKFLKECDIVTTVCESIADHLENQYDVKRPLVIFNSPIHDQHFIPNPVARWGRLAPKSDVRADANIPESEILLVVVGNLTVNRGIETIIDSMTKLPNNYSVAMLGKSTLEFETTLKNLIKERGLEGKVLFLQPVNPVHLVNYLRTADIGLIPIIPKTLSYEFALPNKLFECAYAGLPVVASSTTELSRIISKYNLGNTFEPGNPQSLASTIQAIQAARSKHQEAQNTNSFIEATRFELGVLELMTEVSNISKPKF